MNITEDAKALTEACDTIRCDCWNVLRQVYRANEQELRVMGFETKEDAAAWYFLDADEDIQRLNMEFEKRWPQSTPKS